MNENRTLLSNIGIEIDKIRGNSGKVICPKCSHLRKKKKDPCLSVNISEGIYKCHNCEWSGGVVKSTFKYEERKDYVRPKFTNTTDCSKGVVDWFFTRGISQRTLNNAKVTESNEWMPGNNPGEQTLSINFNYFIDNNLINTKYRDHRKRFRLVKDAELVFYGLDGIKDETICIITEGEIDKLSFDECGVLNSVSVPNGASSSGNPNLDYLDASIDFFTNKKKIILATDNDAPGVRLRDELARRLGYYRCYKVDFKDCKDANEYLQKYGPEKLKETVLDKNLKPFPLSGIINLEDVYDEVDAIITNGGLDRGLLLGIKGIDDLISWVKGQLTVVTGIPNHGKSIIVLQIMLILSIKHGWKWGIFTPEHKPISMFVVKIIEVICGKMSRTRRITKSEIDIAKSFIKDHFFFIQPEDENHKLDNIIEKAKSLVIRHGISGLVIDPWNKLEYEQPAGMSETNFVSQQLDKIISFDQNHGVHTIIIAHPTKAKKTSLSEHSKFAIPELSDIAGSANWHNKPDNGIVFYRDFAEQINKFLVKKVKWEHLGRPGETVMKYNINNSRFSSLSDPHDNSNWLIPDAVQNNLFDPEPPIEFINSEKELEEEEIPF